MQISEQEWADSQSHEARFWRGQAASGNQEQFHRWGWYRDVCFPRWLPERSFAGQYVMDVGSGPAGVLHYIGPARAKIAGDPLMQQYRADGYDVNAQHVIASAVDGERLSAYFSGIDVAFCLNCLDHCRDPQRVLCEIAAVLAPGGTLALCVDMRHPEDMDRLHKIRIDEDWIRAALRAAGFRIEWSANVPHQAPTRTVQFCAICRKEVP